MSADLDFGKLAFKFQGNFELDRQYEKLDCVYYDFSTYLAISASVGEEPSGSSAWVLMCQGYGLASEQEVAVGVDNKAISAKELKKLIQSFKTTKVGTILFSYADLLDEYLLCNGAAISRTTYSALFSVIGTKFGIGDGSTTFNIPDLRGRVLQGASGDNGSYKNAGLPNIIGTVGTFIGGATHSTDALFRSFYITEGGKLGGTQSVDWAYINIDASRYNNKYGASTTVQPPSLALNAFIKY